MLWFDSTVGLAAGGLAYTQIALGGSRVSFQDCFCRKFPAGSIKADVAGRIIAGVLTRRFRFRHNRTDRVFEQLEQCLLTAAERLSSHAHLVGNQFTAADLTLAALMRPVVLVPYFRDHPRFQRLFDWRVQQLHEHHRTITLVTNRRCTKYVSAGVGRSVRCAGCLQIDCVPAEVPAVSAARNDQQSVGGFPLLSGPFEYLRLKQTCELGRTAYLHAATQSHSHSQTRYPATAEPFDQPPATWATRSVRDPNAARQSSAFALSVPNSRCSS